MNLRTIHNSMQKGNVGEVIKYTGEITKLQYIKLVDLCLDGNAKTLKRFIAEEENIKDYKLQEDDVLKIVSRNTSAHHKIMKRIIEADISISVNEEILLKCADNGWKKIAYILAMRYENIDKLNNNKCIISLLKIDDCDLSTKILTKNLEYMGKNEEVMVYLCASGKARLVKRVTSITFIDPNHNGDLFLKAGAKHQNVIDILLKYSTLGDEESKRLNKYIFMSRAGGI